MKKIVALVLVAFVASTVVGCSGTTAPNTTKSTVVTTTKPTSKM